MILHSNARTRIPAAVASATGLAAVASAEGGAECSNLRPPCVPHTRSSCPQKTLLPPPTSGTAARTGSVSSPTTSSWTLPQRCHGGRHRQGQIQTSEGLWRRAAPAVEEVAGGRSWITAAEQWTTNECPRLRRPLRDHRFGRSQIMLSSPQQQQVQPGVFPRPIFRSSRLETVQAVHRHHRTAWTGSVSSPTGVSSARGGATTRSTLCGRGGQRTLKFAQSEMPGTPSPG
jgi:hypothetical protein